MSVTPIYGAAPAEGEVQPSASVFERLKHRRLHNFVSRKAAPSDCYVDDRNQLLKCEN